jgi:YfiH family protein
MTRRTSAEGVVYYISEMLEAIGVPHAFSTRVGGVSEGPFASLNLGNPAGEVVDSWDNIYANYAKLQKAIGVAGHDRAWVHQVHGGEVASVNRGFEFGCKADAMITREPNRLLSVRVADCIPILIASKDGKTVAAVHAGWRGVVAQVAIHAIQKMQISANELFVAIGPSIGVDAFEVGGEVLAEFDPAFCRQSEDGKGHVDLRRVLAKRLVDAGIAEDHLDISDRCTFRDQDEFFSHRRDKGVTGRMAAMIATTP